MSSKDLPGYCDNKLSQRLVLKQPRECLDDSKLSIISAGKATQHVECLLYDSKELLRHSLALWGPPESSLMPLT